MAIMIINDLFVIPQGESGRLSVSDSEKGSFKKLKQEGRKVSLLSADAFNWALIKINCVANFAHFSVTTKVYGILYV